jgi:hypothetical protein
MRPPQWPRPSSRGSGSTMPPPRTALTPHRGRFRALLAVGMALGLVVGLALPGTVGRTRAATQLKAVIIVGPTGSLTSSYENSANAVAAAAAANGMAVTKLYTPDATWANVAKDTAGANLVYFAGHGNGFPNPYVGFLQPQYNDGYGLDPGKCSSKTDCPSYYGEQYVSQIALAPGAIVLLNHLCYAPGASEPGNPVPSQSVAVQRADNFAAGFLAAGAGAVFAADGGDFPSLVDALFSAPDTTTIDQLFETNGFSGAADQYFTSSRTSGARLHLDPQSGGLVYTNTVTGYLGMTVSGWRTAQGRERLPSCPSPTPMPAITAADATFEPLGPTRILDTRDGTGLSGPFSAGVPRTLQVAGNDGVPSDAVAVTINVTLVNQTDAGYLSVTPAPADCPATSTINFPVGDVRANGAVVPLDSSGALSATYMAPWTTSSADVVIDVTGAFVPSGGSTYTPLGPTRILDTRDGTGLKGSFSAGVPRTLQVAGNNGIPTGATAVTINVTAVDQTRAGYLSVTTAPTADPQTSTLNFPVGDVRANGAVVPLASDGTLSITYGAPSGATTDVVIDVTGYSH